MITRAQAEALLTLAESLEACERLGVTVSESYDGIRLESLPARDVLEWSPGADFTGINIRLAANALTSKQDA